MCARSLLCAHSLTHVGVCITVSLQTWFTPGEVVRRIGEDTYRIKVGHGQFRERHESQLRVREPDLRGQHVSLSYAAHEADSDDDYAEQDDYTVEKILAQRPKASAPGGMEFKVRWRGYGPSHNTCGSIIPSWSTSAGTRPRSMSRTWQHSPGQLQPGVLISALSSPLMRFERL